MVPDEPEKEIDVMEQDAVDRLQNILMRYEYRVSDLMGLKRVITELNNGARLDITVSADRTAVSFPLAIDEETKDVLRLFLKKLSAKVAAIEAILPADLDALDRATK